MKKSNYGGKRHGSGAKKKTNAKTQNAQIRCTKDAYNGIMERIKIYAQEEEKRVLNKNKKGVEL